LSQSCVWHCSRPQKYPKPDDGHRPQLQTEGKGPARLYAHRTDNNFHTIARTAISRLINDGLPWGIPIACVYEFLAVVTNPRIFKEPTVRHIARIAALCIEHGATQLWSAGRDFSAYEQLQIRRPEHLVQAK
jgi:hypothetical protein